MEKILNIVVSKACPFAGIDLSEENQNLVNKAIEEGHTPIPIQYFHGILDDKVGYDIGVCLNGELCADVENGVYIPGIYEANVIGYDKPVKAFLWQDESNRPTGLIVDQEDKEAFDYATEHYNKKSSSFEL